MVERPGERKITDLDFQKSIISNTICSRYEHTDGTVLSKSFLDITSNSLKMNFKVKCPKRVRQQIKLANFCITNEHLDYETLYYSTNLGGDEQERFEISSNFDQDETLNLNVVGKNGFTPTTGRFRVGDKNRYLEFFAPIDDCFYLVRISTHSNTKNLL